MALARIGVRASDGSRHGALHSAWVRRFGRAVVGIGAPAVAQPEVEPGTGNCPFRDLARWLHRPHSPTLISKFFHSYQVVTRYYFVMRAMLFYLPGMRCVGNTTL